jgi:hypothetical protein
VLQPELNFIPSPDVTLLLKTLLDRLERQRARPVLVSEARPARSVKVGLSESGLPGYFSQIDPEPRQLANEQLQALEKVGSLRLFWQAGEKDHLLESVALVPTGEALLYDLIQRTPISSLRVRLESQILGDRFRFGDLEWRYRAIQHILSQIKQNKSPAPFSLTDPVFNEDLLIALIALAQLNEETPYRVFSVRAFNDSKRFDDLKSAVVRLARLGHPDWKRLKEDELLRELNLVANPTYLLLAGPWTLVDREGQVLSLGEFNPSVGVPAAQAVHLARVSVRAVQVICVENLTTFHTLAGSLLKDPNMQKTAVLCLAGNPSPACRKLLACLSSALPEEIPLYVWADMDYGGFNILSQLRKMVNPGCRPYHMDQQTLDRFAPFARPLTLADRGNLERQSKRPELRDVHPVIAYLLQRGLKLEQEAITL